jgi:hypothetical protein
MKLEQRRRFWLFRFHTRRFLESLKLWRHLNISAFEQVGNREDL